MKRRVCHIVNKLFEFLHIYHVIITKEEIKESYQELVTRLKKEGIYRDE